MIAQSPAERALYESRLKFQRDAASRLHDALEEGKELGREEGRVAGRREGMEEGEQLGKTIGEQIGKIQLLQQLLGVSEPTREALDRMDLVALEALATDLQAELRSRG